MHHSPTIPISQIPNSFGKLSNAQDKRQIYAQHIFFHGIIVAASFFLAAYYSILLLRESNNSIPVVITSHAAFYTGILLGFYLGGTFLSRLGYLTLYRLACLIYLGFSLITVITIDNILDVYVVLNIFRGIGLGFFHSAHNIFTLRELQGTYRGRTLSINASLHILFSVFLPFIAGSLIEVQGYTVTFLLASILYLVGIIYPWKYNLVPHTPFNLGELKRASKKRGFKRWSAVTMSSMFLNDIREITLAILPFLFLKSEFGVGLFASILGLAGMTFVFLHRNDKLKKRIHIGFIGAGIIDASILVFVVIWNVPALVITGVIGKLGTALFGPSHESVVYRNQELLLGDFVQDSAMELQVYIEILYYFARMFNALLFVIIIFALQVDPLNLLRIALAVSALHEIVGLFIKVKLGEFLKR